MFYESDSLIVKSSSDGRCRRPICLTNVVKKIRGRVDTAKSCLWQYSEIAVVPPFVTTANLNPSLVLTTKLVTYKYMVYKFNSGITVS